MLCPGLFEAIQAVHPPGVSFFRRLPSDGSGRWAVYALVLDKPGALPLIYIGSGTEMKRGIPSRWLKYNKPKANSPAVPHYVRRAVDDGYKIPHKGLLVWCSIPSAANAPRFRLLFVAIEATLSFLFWAMKSKVEDYGMSICCPGLEIPSLMAVSAAIMLSLKWSLGISTCPASSSKL